MVLHGYLHHVKQKHQNKPTYKIYLSSPDPQTGEAWNENCKVASTILSELFTFQTSEAQTSSSSASSSLPHPQAVLSSLSSNNPYKTATTTTDRKSADATTTTTTTTAEQPENEESDEFKSPYSQPPGLKDPLHLTNQPGKPVALVVRVGSEHEWRDPTSELRAGSLGLVEVPCVVKWRDGKEVARLAGEDCFDGTRLEGLMSA